MRVLLVTVENPYDPRSWSGTALNLRKSLEHVFEVVDVLSTPKPKVSWYEYIPRIIFGRKKYPLWMTESALKFYAKKLQSAIDLLRPDAVFSVSSQHLIYIKQQKLPIFMFSDAPWKVYKDTYSDYEVMPFRATKYASHEKNVAQRINGVIYPSQWACDAAHQKFSIEKKNIHLVPMGANQFCEYSEQSIESKIIQKGKEVEINFLFVGKDWERKGGPFAVKVVQEFIKLGRRAKLSIVGCAPDIHPSEKEFVDIIGYLPMNSKNNRDYLSKLFFNAHFFVLPSRAECYGLVYAEAQSYGVPCIGFDINGVTEVVKNNETGYLYGIDVQPNVVARDIDNLFFNGDKYINMGSAARAHFLERLNWVAFGGSVRMILEGAPAEGG